MVAICSWADRRGGNFRRLWDGSSVDGIVRRSAGAQPEGL